MMRTVMGITHFALLAVTVFAQPACGQAGPPAAPTPGIPPASAPAAGADSAFVIADVRVSPHLAMPRGGGYPMVRGDRYMLRQTSMRDLIGLAYGINPGLVRKGPTWLEINHYDITAKMPAGATPDTEKFMLRSLLEDRFKLVAHNDTEQMQANTLLPGKDKVRMKPSDGSGETGCKFQPPPQDQSPGTINYMEFSCHNISMAVFVQNLHNWIYDYFPGPISDSTGLKGTWDFDLKWSNRVQLATAGGDGISIYDAIDKQLGLKLGTQLSSIPVVIVDSLNETPTPNSPDLAKILPPQPPPEFDVATIKLAMPGERAMLQFNGVQLNAQTPLKLLIYFAWDLNFSDDEALANAPKWLDSDHYDIVAKLATDADGKPPIIDDEDFRRLLRELLTDRFQMKTHMEDRPVDAYTLIAVNPKLTKADPTSRTRCGKTPGPDGKDPRIANPALDKLWYCQNVTMAQAADMFREMLAPDYIYNPIEDATGITGSWDFVLSFSSARLTMGGGMGAPPSADGATAPDPIGAVSFFDAVNKQLGLKLVKQKRPLPVLVIDHIEEKPTEN
jgi:uncharacterized protein (TIGR03435 family)